MAMSPQEAFAHFLGWTYTGEGKPNRVPVAGDLVPASLVRKDGEARAIDCSTFATSAVEFMHAGLVAWDADAYEDCQVWDAKRPWSAPEAWRRHGLGGSIVFEPLGPEGMPAFDVDPSQGWGVYQGWVSVDPLKGGHQWFYSGAMGVRVHSSSRGKVGPIWVREDWADIRAYYKAGIRGVSLEHRQ